MAKVEVTETETTTKTVDVEFPVLWSHHGTLGMIFEDRTGVSVSPPDARGNPKSDEWRLTLIEDYDFSEASGADYHLGRGIHGTTEGHFRQVFGEFLLAVEEAEGRVPE